MNGQEMSPDSSRKMFAKKTRNYDLALQGPFFTRISHDDWTL
jgi:hypothetical protein